ncbi:hypothetical protein BgiBS90_022784 [Biomphalaria glabrata]|nr:hypothetical protein BgiBS90_022784 [Biomphalaria glabrata]
MLHTLSGSQDFTYLMVVSGRHTDQTFPVPGAITKIISVEYRPSILWHRLSELITGSPLLGYTSSARSHLKAAHVLYQLIQP